MASSYCPHCYTQIQAAAHGGAPAQCHHCGAALTGAASASVDNQWPQEEITLVTPLEEPAEATYWQQEVADAEVVEEAEFAESAPRRRVPFEVFFFLTTLVVLLAVGVTAVALLLYLQPERRQARSSDASNSGSPFVSTSNDDERPHRWLPADEGALLLGKTRVEIIRAEWGEARGKDASGVVIISDDRYLQIILRIENTSFDPIEYRSWYGNDFAIEDSAVRVELTDNLGREYPWVIFEDVVRVRWHVPAATIEAQKYIEDVIIFEIPPDTDRASVDYFHLSLPAAALGKEGSYYFELPRDMIVDF